MRVVVTGGGGFLGSAVARQLVERGDAVTSVSRSHHAALDALGVDQVSVDLGSGGRALVRALDGADAVVHCAAKAGFWGPREAYLRANVDGTQNVVGACLAAGVPVLVHTSSPSACFDGTDHVDAGPDLPLATEFLAAYPESKARAEALALAASGPDLAVCALRPHLILGEGDPHLLPRLVARARRGRLVRVGDGTNVVSLTHVDNAAAAHLAALDRLSAEGAAAPCAGRGYFVAQRESVRLWDWIGELLRALDVPPVRRHLSRAAAHRLGAACELLWRGLSLPGEPPMTRFVAAQLATSHSYDLAPTERDLGYRERVDLAECTRRCVAWLREPRS